MSKYSSATYQATSKQEFCTANPVTEERVSKSIKKDRLEVIHESTLFMMRKIASHFTNNSRRGNKKNYLQWKGII